MKSSRLTLSVIIISSLMFSSCKKEDPNAPNACFTFPDEIFAGTPTSFNSSCSENAVSFAWNFGDGGSSDEAHPDYTFLDDGSYNVTLEVTSANGAKNKTAVTITVMAPSFIEHSGNIESDETWNEGVHVITGDVYVDGAILTIQPGALIRFSAGRGLYLGYHTGSSGATLIANGTLDKPITFTSAATTKSAGDWDYIGFYNGASSSSSMQYCIVEYAGGYSETFGAIYIDGSSVNIGNSHVRYSESNGISLTDDGFFQSFTDNTVEDNGKSAIRIYGNYAHTIGSGNILQSDRGISVIGDRLEEAAPTWLKQTVAYVVEGDLYVGSATGTTLTLSPGVELRLGGGTGIYFGYYNSTFGTLLAEGTQTERIEFTSAAPSTAKSAGDWDYIGFYDGAGSSSSLDYCNFEYGGGYGSDYGMIYVDGSSVSLTNSTLMHSQNQGISLRDDATFTACSGNTFEDNELGPIEIYGNYANSIGTGNTYNSGKGILLVGDKIEESEVTWTMQDVPYICDGDMYLGSSSGSILNIEAGTEVQFTEGTGFYIGYYSGTIGVLVADGDAGSEISFTSAAPSGFQSTGDWDGIFFRDGTGTGTVLDHCIIAYGGGYSSSSGNLTIRVENYGVPEITNCQILNSAAWGIYLYSGALPTLGANTFSGNASGDTNE